jgi:hypothetical protein
MKKIATLTEIPRNDEFKITERANKLMNQVGRARIHQSEANRVVARFHPQKREQCERDQQAKRD